MKPAKPLGLRIQRQWLQAIVSGKKKIEYRDFTDHYVSRFGYRDGEDVVCRDDIKALRLYVSSVEYVIVELKKIDFEKPIRDNGQLTTPFRLHLGKVILDKSRERLSPAPKVQKRRKQT